MWMNGSQVKVSNGVNGIPCELPQQLTTKLKEIKLNLLKYCLAKNNLCLSILADHDQLFCDRLFEDNMLGVCNCIL